MKLYVTYGSPYARLAHVFWPALFVFLMQGFQIDIDHWRHVYLGLGMVWGLECARLRWAAHVHAQTSTAAGLDDDGASRRLGRAPARN